MRHTIDKDDKCSCGGKAEQSETSGRLFCTNSGDELLYTTDGEPLRDASWVN